MGKNGLLIQNLLPSKSDHCARNCRCAPEMTNQKEKIQEMNHQMENQMENLLIRIGQQKKVKKWHSRTPKTGEFNNPLLALAGGILLIGVVVYVMKQRKNKWNFSFYDVKQLTEEKIEGNETNRCLTSFYLL